MSFLSGAFLFGLAAAAIPVVIHLIHRQRYPERPFTTLRFFDRTVKHNILQRRLIDKILLVLRVLAIAAIMVGLARPFWTGRLGERRRSVVIVLDNSPSMGRAAGAKTLFEQAKAAAAAVIDQLGPTDRAELLLTAPAGEPVFTTDHQALRRELELLAGRPAALLVQGEAGRQLSLPQMTADAEALRVRLDHLPAGTPAALVSLGGAEVRLGYDRVRLRRALSRAGVSSLAGDIRGAMSLAGRMLGASADGDRRAVVLSDLQAGEWSGGAIMELAGILVAVAPVEPAGPRGPNLGIESAGAVEQEAGLGQSVLATATIRNYGDAASPQARLTVTAGERGRPVEIEVPPIAPGTTMRVSFPIHVMSRERTLLCSAVVNSPTDPFDYDDTWHFQLGVRPPVTALCVSPRAPGPSPSPAEEETFFLVNALAPRGGGAAETLVDARQCRADDLKDRQLFQYGVVVLTGAPVLDGPTRQKLQQFVSDGGGLLVFPGAKAQPEECNGWGFLPARVGERKTGSFVYIRSLAEDASAVAGVAARVGTGICALSTDSWLVLEGGAGSKVLARLSSGDPALVEGRIGRGRVILAATGCHTADSDWPIRPAFVILVRSLVKHLGALARGVRVAPWRLAGEGASMEIPAELGSGTPAAFRLRRQGQRHVYDALPWLRTGRSLVLPAATTAGHYLLSVRPGAEAGMLDEPGLGASVASVSVNHNARESRLAPLPAARLADVLGGADVTVAKPGGDPARLLTDRPAGRDLWRWLLMAAVVLLVLEGLLAWRSASESAG